MKDLIFDIYKINELLEIHNQEFEEVIAFLNNNFIQVVEKIKIIKSSYNHEILLIIYLNRDKRSNLRTALTKHNIKNLKSVYININNKSTYLFGDPYITENISNFIFQIYPNSSYDNIAKSKFFSDINFFSPKGKTRSAIILSSNNGIIPIHLFNLYNKVYSVDENINSFKNSKENLKLNKINNVLTYNLDYISWLKNFENGNYSSPGKKNPIGNFLFYYKDYKDFFIKFIDIIKPESILIYNDEDFDLSLNNYLISKNITSYKSIIKKYKLTVE